MHLVVIGVVDQRYQAVMAVLHNGWKVSKVAEHFGVARQTVHRWMARQRWRSVGADGWVASTTQHGSKRLPVVGNDGFLLGIISRGDRSDLRHVPSLVSSDES